jgi:hypothetical protein
MLGLKLGRLGHIESTSYGTSHREASANLGTDLLIYIFKDVGMRMWWNGHELSWCYGGALKLIPILEDLIGRLCGLVILMTTYCRLHLIRIAACVVMLVAIEGVDKGDRVASLTLMDPRLA